MLGKIEMIAEGDDGNICIAKVQLPTEDIVVPTTKHTLLRGIIMYTLCYTTLVLFTLLFRDTYQILFLNA